MKVAVTGATGFVGAHTTAALLAAGHEVRALVRDRSRLTRTVGALGVDLTETVVGPMTDAGAVAELLDGCDAVVHAAAVVSLDRRHAASMAAQNPRGTALVAGGAAERGLDPIVCVSSTSAVYRPDAGPLRSDMPVADLHDGYSASKAASEREARRLQAEGAPVVITYPGGILGPAAGTALGEASTGVAKFLSLRSIPTRGGALSIVDVRDLAATHAALVEPGLGPRRVMVGGHLVTMTELSRLLEELTGRRCPVVPVPPAALRLSGALADALRRIVPVPGPLTAEGMGILTRWPGTDDDVEAIAGVRLRPVDETLADSLRSWVDTGLLDRRALGRLAS
ncbi:MAG: NAD-dependent epimerase/dehydratase family protein [Acidimicrobiales bacterium]|nr:NAD-dependent epimerase/dehydratase family protein [Acidimicrobiales bacterium]